MQNLVDIVVAYKLIAQQSVYSLKQVMSRASAAGRTQFARDKEELELALCEI